MHNENRNPRSVTSVVVVISLVLGTAIAIPVAVLRAADTVNETDDDGESGKSECQVVAAAAELPASFVAAASDQTPAPAAAQASERKPELKDSQSLFRIWQKSARTDGKIPGAMIGRLDDWVKYFIELNKDEGAGGKLSVKFEQLLPRFVATRDWTPTDAIALLDEVSAIHTIPLRNALDAAAEKSILTGEPLPVLLKECRWGKPAENGLRVAWPLEPRRKEYRLDTSLRSRILVHNSGREPVVFVMPSWQQSGGHVARDSNNEDIRVTSVEWTTIPRMMIYRLAPGTYCETRAPGIGVGARTNDEDWANVRAGSWILAKEGDDVRFTPDEVEIRMSPFAVGLRHGNGLQNPKDAADLWNSIVVERVEREMPIPSGAADREQILRRIVLDLFGVEPSAAEIAAFVADKSPGANHPLLSSQLVTARVVHNRKTSSFTGTLPPGTISFRVLAADPDAAKRPRVATEPGYYILGDRQRLHVEQARIGERRVNKGTITFFSSAPKTDPPAAPHVIRLPDGQSTYAIAWDRDAGTLWILQKELVRSYDFTTPAQVKETRFESGGIVNVPERFHEALKSAFDSPDAPVQQQQK